MDARYALYATSVSRSDVTNGVHMYIHYCRFFSVKCRDSLFVSGISMVNKFFPAGKLNR